MGAARTDLPPAAYEVNSFKKRFIQREFISSSSNSVTTSCPRGRGEGGLRSDAGHRNRRSKVTAESVVPNLLKGLLYSFQTVASKWGYDIMLLFKKRFV